MVKQFELANGTINACETSQGFVSVYVNPDQAERDYLIKTYDIDEHTLSSASDPDEISRIEIVPEGLFIIWKRPINYSGGDDFLFNVASAGLFLLKDRLIIIVSEDTPLTGVRKVPLMSSHLEVMLNFLYETIHHYIHHLKVIKVISRELQAKINTSMENIHLIHMFNLSESLVYYENAINGNNAVLSRLRNYGEKNGFTVEVMELLDDLLIENHQCFKQTEIYSTVFTGLMDARGNIVNNNMNMLLKSLTVLNIVFLPLNLIAGIGGMSEFGMMTQGIDWRISYSLFTVAMVLIGWATARTLNRLDISKADPKKRRLRDRITSMRG